MRPAVTIATRAARAAGELILRHLDRIHTLEIEHKGRHDYVSQVDRMAEELIVRELRHAWPDCAILGEEGGERGSSTARRVWIVDPLDGTSNFLRGIPHFAVSIALMEQGQLVDAVVFDPVRNELFTASRGSGALLNGRRLRVGQRVQLDGALLATGFPFREPEHLPAHLEMLRRVLEKAEDLRRTGSAALDLAWVACGRLDGYFEYGLAPWDMAAGSLLVREAGGRCADFANGDRYLFSGGVIAANVKLCGLLYETLRPAVSEAMLARLAEPRRSRSPRGDAKPSPGAHRRGRE
ncbi:MAG: inositol monophosphatase [Lysobacterales bacterium]|nr:MAG: inositol monophosphatase [Xanthomonadales bacterium]